jgi:hypothetical protein
MDFKNKYLKYKKKYLNLRLKIGGNTNYVAGPVSFRHLKNKQYGNNLYIFGDVHESTENMCIKGSNSKLLHLFIDEIIKQNPEIQFDIGIEQGRKEIKIFAKQDTPLATFDNYFSNIVKEKKYNNLRLHFLDNRIVKKIYTVDEFTNSSNDPVIQKFDIMRDNLKFLKQSFEFTDNSLVTKVNRNDKSQNINIQIKISPESKSYEKYYEKRVNKNTTKIVEISLGLYRIIHSFKDLGINEKPRVNLISALGLDPQKVKLTKRNILYKTENESITEKLDGTTLETSFCKLNYKTNSENKCIKEYFDELSLEKKIVNEIKKIKKVDKFFTDDDYFKRHNIDPFNLESYIKKRVIELIKNRKKKYGNDISFMIIDFEENLRNVFNFIEKENYQELHKLSFDKQKKIRDIIFDRSFDGRLNFSYDEFIKIIYFFKGIIEDVRVLIMDIYSIIRISKLYFTNTILYLGDEHSRNIADFFTSYGNYKTKFEKNKNNSNNKIRCIDVGNSFSKENLRSVTQLVYEELSESEKSKRKNNELMSDEDVDTGKILKEKEEMIKRKSEYENVVARQRKA